MNILCCYTEKNPYGRHVNLQPETARLMAILGADLRCVDNDEEGYWACLAEKWTAGETLINVEHDILPSYNDIEEMWHCDKDWCACEYEMGDVGHWRWGLGCMKFGEKLMRLAPGLLGEVGRYSPSETNMPMSPKHWARLDGRIYAAMSRHWPTLLPHVHGRVQHLNPYHHGAEFPRVGGVIPSPGAPTYRSRPA